MKYDKLNDSQKEKLIKELYSIKKQSFQQIAELYDTYPNKIRRDAKKFNIDIRNKSEAQKNALDNGSHKHPTKGQTRPENIKSKIGKSVLEKWESLDESELKTIKQKARDRWEKLSDDEKENRISAAIQAVRKTSKTGSKLENFIHTKLVKSGYKVDFHKEQTLSNTKLQIDIFIPSLNVAIEIDGPSHFLPVWGDDTLQKNIKYDNKKTGLVLGKGCALIRIKQTRDFSNARAEILWEKLSEILSSIKTKFPNPQDRLINIGD
jgi:very-short-patch-repair endonuclease